MALDQESFDILLSAIQRFVRDRLTPLETYLEEHDEVPEELVLEMKEMGLFGLSIPQEFGGIGLSMTQETRVAYEFGKTSLAFRSVFGTNVGIGSQGILIDGTPEQKSLYLPKVASGELIMSFALTEPGAGSDAASLTTKATLDGDSYVLSGTKRYISNAPRAGAFTLMARTGGEGSSGISAFIVPANSAGLKLGKNDKKMGQRGTKTSDVILEGVRVPRENIIGGVPGQGFKTAMKVLDRGRLHIAAAACGTARRILSESVAYAKERVQFGKPIGTFQLVQAMLAQGQSEAIAGWALVQEVAQQFEQKGIDHLDTDLSMRVSCAKMFCTEMVGRVADSGVQIHGGAGYINDYPVERFYRDVRLLRLYEGTTQIQQLIIGREMLRQGSSSY